MQLSWWNGQHADLHSLHTYCSLCRSWHSDTRGKNNLQLACRNSSLVYEHSPEDTTNERFIPQQLGMENTANRIGHRKVSGHVPHSYGISVCLFIRHVALLCLNAHF